MARKGKKSTGATLQTKKHLSSLLFFFSSVYSNFTIQYNIFEFNKLQWFILFVGGVSLWLIPFVIEKTANKMIITLILAILNMIMYLVYIIATSGLATGLYLFLSFSNALLIPLLAVQAVEDAIPPELELMQRKISQRNRIPVQRLFLAILIAAPVGILTGYFTNDNVMAMVLLFFNLLSFSWFAYEHDSDYRAFMRPDRKVESKEQNIDDYRLVSQSENELLAPISDSTERLESSESESVVALDWKIVCTKTTFYGLVSKLPRLFYYCYYWCLLTVVLIYMYQLSCQFRYNKEEIKPAYLRVYPLLFTVASYPVIEWKILPELKVHKTFHKLLLSTVCAVLSLIVATILESYRVTETYGTDYYSQNPFTDKRVSSCPADLDDYCNDVPYSSTYKACHYPPMMSEQLHVGWQSIQFLLLSFSISLAGSCFLDFCFYEFFPSSSFISITLSTGLIRFFMCVVILIQYYILDPSKLIDYLTFNLNEKNIPILLIYASLFIGFFFLYLFIEYFPFQEYYDYFSGEFFQINKEETVQILSSAPPPPFNPLAAAANLPQPEPVIPFHPLREYVPAFTHILTEKDEKYDVFLTHDWGTATTQFLNHRRVSAVNAKLSALGLKTWFDEERMEGWNVRDQMTRGISHAHCVIVFITERYASKINSANPADNCYYEFNFAVHRVSTHKMIPVVMEEAMKDTRQWQGRLAAELANHLYVNMSDVIPKIVPENISNVKEVDDKALKPNTVNGIDEDDALEFDQKCTEIVDLVGSVLVKPLKDLTTEQTVLFFKSVGCLGIEDVLKEKRIVLTGKHLNTVETLEDLLSLDLNLPRIMVRTILEEILHCKDCGVRMSKLLRNVSRCA